MATLLQSKERLSSQDSEIQSLICCDALSDGGIAIHYFCGPVRPEGEMIRLAKDTFACVLDFGPSTGMAANGFAGNADVFGGAIQLLPKSSADLWIIHFPIEVITEWMKPYRPGLKENLRLQLFDKGNSLLVFPLSDALRALAQEFRSPPVPGMAARFWFEGKVRELIARTFFVGEVEPDEEFFCTRQHRIGESRVSRAKELIKERLDESFDLSEIAASVGCSPAYLSRTFSEFAGMTMTSYLRFARIERAAELLRSGRFNVSETAVEVGYNSLSHFSKAFQREKGCLPSRFIGGAA